VQATLALRSRRQGGANDRVELPLSRLAAPQRLYHYTTISNLALILKTKRIRFNRLDKVNDFEDGLSSDLNSADMCVFVSCFTGNPDESILLWNLYTPKMRGVRIEFTKHIFSNSFTSQLGIPSLSSIKLKHPISIDRKEIKGKKN
jgi:hypothetical protein